MVVPNGGKGNCDWTLGGGVAAVMTTAETAVPFRHISVEGQIGAGKSSLVTALAAVLGYRGVMEQFKGNPYFAAFYKDMGSVALKAQLWFMADRIETHEAVHASGACETGVVFDRSAWGDRVFMDRMCAAGDADDLDHKLYYRFFDLFAKRHGGEMPDAVIVLNVPIEVLMARIRRRARKDEDISEAYLRSFEPILADFVEDMGKVTRVFRVDWSPNLEVGEEEDSVSQAMRGAAIHLLNTMAELAGDAKTGVFDIPPRT